MPNKTTMGPKVWQYLEQRDYLSLPSQEMQDSLIRAYFHYVHPFAPIIDVADFVHRFTTGQLSLLLLWSMFAAAANVSELILLAGETSRCIDVSQFIDEQVLPSELGSTRIEIKAEAFQRAMVRTCHIYRVTPWH